jgi:hypothetical protein
LLLGVGLLAPPVRLRAQQAASPAADTPAAPAAEASVLDLGDCPDTPSGFEQGNTYACMCPSNPPPATIYGTAVYSNDSNICVAAIHAGVLRKGVNGQVVLQVVSSPPVFRGKTQSGIKSEVWPKPTASAFQFSPTNPASPSK